MPYKYSLPAATLSLPVLLLCLVLNTAHAQEGRDQLLQKYAQIQAKLAQSVYHLPIDIASADSKNTMQGDVYGIIPHPFSDVRQALASATHWCDIVPLHFNIKACTYQAINQHCQVTFYTGRKYYEPAAQVYQLAYHFDLVANEPGYLQVKLFASDGPMGTSNYQVSVDAIPLGGTGTFIHFRYAYHYNFFTRLGMTTYLSTLGRGKVGFTITDTGQEDKPIYITGIRGIIERNAVRYFFAIQSYLDTVNTDGETHFIERLNRWFDLTETHPLQLHEMERQAYLEDKQKERQEQLLLQQDLPDPVANQRRCN